MLDQGYGIMPNSVLFDINLSDKQKLLFCYISSLCAEKGYCRASNEYVGKKLGVQGQTISSNVSQLEKQGYISVNIEEGYKRKITLLKNHDGGIEKSIGGGIEKSIHNSTIDNIIKEHLPDASENLIQAVKDHNDIRSSKEKIQNLTKRGQKIVFSHIMKQGGNEKEIIEAIEFSIAQGYKGVFAPKTQKQDPTKNRTDKQRLEEYGKTAGDRGVKFGEKHGQEKKAYRKARYKAEVLQPMKQNYFIDNPS